MPKNRKVTKVDHRIIRENMPRKMLIGTRKTGVSAFGMTIEALKAVLGRVDQKRYHNKARAVLASRGVTV
jgi:hypothetical protein